MTHTTTVLALSLFLLSSAVLPAQGLEIERTISGFPENVRGTMAMTAKSQDRLDFNGDGIPERTFVVDDPTYGDVLRIVDGSDAGRSWTVRLEGDPDYPIIVGRHMLVGFFDLDGVMTNENPKELVFARRAAPQGYLKYKLEDVIVSSYNSTQTYSPWQPLGIIAILIGIVDADRDGKDEIMLANPAAAQTEIWGAP